MCFGGGSPPPAPAAPAEPQAAKAPDIADYTRSKKKSGGAMAGGTLLTGPSGVAPSALSVAKPSLLGQ